MATTASKVDFSNSAEVDKHMETEAGRAEFLAEKLAEKKARSNRK
jgi:hypothetical protein